MMIARAKLGNPEQLASVVLSTVAEGPAAGCRAMDVRTWGGIDARLLPDRGLDVGAAWFRGVPLAWISPAGERPPLPVEELTGERWRDAWQGGLVTTCGLSNVGAPSDGHGLHGTYSHRSAAALEVERGDQTLAVTAVIDDPPFRVERRVSSALGVGLLRIDDVVVNASEWTAAAPLLYHVNLGAPLWDDGAWLETDATEVVPRDEDAAVWVEAWDLPPAPAEEAPERVFEHEGATWARLTSPDGGVELTIRSSLPRLWQWVHPAAGTYALGIEPANCSVLGRKVDVEAGRMPLLDPGEARESWLTIEARSIG
jgi:hypothetical protein